MSKHYISNIVTEMGEFQDSLPEKIELTVDEALAREIVRISAWIHDSAPGVFIQTTEVARCLRHDPDLTPEQALADPDGNVMRSHQQRLHIAANSFMVSAYVIDPDWESEVQTEWFPVAGLIEHFGLDASPIPSPLQAFAKSVADLPIWHFNATSQRDCAPKSYLDSHLKLMEAIETARKVIRST